MTNESPQIQKVTYRRSMLEEEDPKEERSGLKESILSRDSLTPKIVQSIHENDLLSGAGIYGEKGVGDPVQYATSKSSTKEARSRSPSTTALSCSS